MSFEGLFANSWIIASRAQAANAEDKAALSIQVSKVLWYISVKQAKLEQILLQRHRLVELLRTALKKLLFVVLKQDKFSFISLRYAHACRVPHKTKVKLFKHRKDIHIKSNNQSWADLY